MVEATTLQPTLATEIQVDIRSRPTPEVLAGIISIMDYAPVGVFRHARPVSDADHVAFSRLFGPVERMKTPPMPATTSPTLRRPPTCRPSSASPRPVCW